MPNSQINPSLATALQSSFGGTPQPQAPQQPTPAPAPSGASGAGSLWDALSKAIGPTGTGVFDKSIQERSNGR